MEEKIDKTRNCFTFIWKIVNADYHWKYETDISSHPFMVKEMHETNWILRVCFYLKKNYASHLSLRRQADNKGEENVEIDCELAFLSPDGTVLHSSEIKNSAIGKDGMIEDRNFPSWNEVFSKRRSVFLSEGTLTVRCRMWKSVGEIPMNMQTIALSRVATKISFVWNIRDFSLLKPDKAVSTAHKTELTDAWLLRLEFYTTQRRILDEMIMLKIIPNFKYIQSATLLVAITDASGNKTLCFQDELFYQNSYEWKEYILFYSRTELMEKRSAYLQDDVLALWVEFCYCSGNIREENEGPFSNIPAIVNNESDDRLLDERSDVPLSSYYKNNLVLNNACDALELADQHRDSDLKSFVQDFILSNGEQIINSERWDQLMEDKPKLAAETMRLKFK